MARKLLIAIWRYVSSGIIPEGAQIAALELTLAKHSPWCSFRTGLQHQDDLNQKRGACVDRAECCPTLPAKPGPRPGKTADCCRGRAGSRLRLFCRRRSAQPREYYVHRQRPLVGE